MPKARAWRSSGKTKKRTSGHATLSQGAMPTRERLEKASGAFEIGGDGSRRIVRMLDAPLEQLRARSQITEQQYRVLERLRLHWYLGHHAGSLRAADLNRVMASNRDYGETATEQALRHRELFDAAADSLSKLECAVMTWVILGECSVTEIGALIGYRSPYRGRQAVIEILGDVAGKIMSVWLTMTRY